MNAPQDENARLREHCERLKAQLDAVERERDHWKEKHDDVARRARILLDAIKEQFGADLETRFATPWPWPVSMTDEDARKIVTEWGRPIGILSGYRAGDKVHYVAEVPGACGVARVEV
jgi:hypothetical protein